MVSHESDYGKVAPNHAIEDVDWVHEGQGGFARSMEASIIMWLNGCSVTIWTTNMGFTWR